MRCRSEGSRCRARDGANCNNCNHGRGLARGADRKHGPFVPKSVRLGPLRGALVRLQRLVGTRSSACDWRWPGPTA